MFASKVKPVAIARSPEWPPSCDFAESWEIVGGLGPALVGPIHEFRIPYASFDAWIRLAQCFDIIGFLSIIGPLGTLVGVFGSRERDHYEITGLARFGGFPRQVDRSVFGKCGSAGELLPESLLQLH